MLCINSSKWIDWSQFGFNSPRIEIRGYSVQTEWIRLVYNTETCWNRFVSWQTVVLTTGHHSWFIVSGLYTPRIEIRVCYFQTEWIRLGYNTETCFNRFVSWQTVVLTTGVIQDSSFRVCTHHGLKSVSAIFKPNEFGWGATPKPVSTGLYPGRLWF